MASCDRAKIYLIPRLRSAKKSELRILMLADGNHRAEGAGGGYAAGARNVVAAAEHLALRGDVALLLVCILSRDNIEKRSDSFFSTLREAFVALTAAITSKDALVGRGVRLDVHGDLARLRARGGAAADLVPAIEAAVRATSHLEAPAMRLALGVGYAETAALELDIDMILRTGMERGGVLRLSGLGAHAGMLNAGTTTLWPALRPSEIDSYVDDAKERACSGLAPGYSREETIALIEAVAVEAFARAVEITVPSYAPIAPLEESALVRVVRPDSAALRDYQAMIAPGQEPPWFVLPERPWVGQAHVHPSEASASGIVRAIREALAFSEAHPPLLGAERSITRLAG